jgi:cysteine desulfuration protein SufE
MSSEVADAQQELVEEFQFFDNWMDRYQYLIDLGRRLPEFAISDAAIVSGLIAVLLRIYSGKKPKDILDTPPDFVSALQLEAHLSPTRSNGLASMLKAIRDFATEALQAT